MTAKNFHRELKKLKAPTDRKIVNLGKKLGLKDSLGEIIWYTGLKTTACLQFIEEKASISQTEER